MSFFKFSPTCSWSGLEVVLQCACPFRISCSWDWRAICWSLSTGWGSVHPLRDFQVWCTAYSPSALSFHWKQWLKFQKFHCAKLTQCSWPNIDAAVPTTALDSPGFSFGLLRVLSVSIFCSCTFTSVDFTHNNDYGNKSVTIWLNSWFNKLCGEWQVICVSFLLVNATNLIRLCFLRAHYKPPPLLVLTWTLICSWETVISDTLRTSLRRYSWTHVVYNHLKNIHTFSFIWFCVII